MGSPIIQPTSAPLSFAAPRLHRSILDNKSLLMCWKYLAGGLESGEHPPLKTRRGKLYTKVIT